VPESESKSSSDLPDFIPANLIQREPFFDRRSDTQSPIPPVREGLPPTYRMRADAHYVDQLTRPSSSLALHLLKIGELESSDEAAVPPPAPLVASIARHGVLQPLLVQRWRGRYRLLDGRRRLAACVAVGLSEVPCLMHDVDDAEAAAIAEAANAFRRESTSPAPGGTDAEIGPTIGRELLTSLEAVTSSVNLFSAGAARLSRLVAGDLIRAELWRSSCLLETGRALRGERMIAMTPIPPRRVFDRVARQMETEARLRGMTLDLKTIDLPPDAVVRGDESLLAIAVSSMALATLAIVEDVPHARVALSLSSRVSGSVVFDVSQDAVVAPPAWASRAFESTWVDRPGGASAALWVLGARQIAGALGGKAVVVATTLGTTISLTVPLSADRQDRS